MTVTIGNIATSGTDVSVPLLDQTKLFEEPKLGSSSSDGNKVVTVYRYQGSDPSQDTQVTVAVTYMPNVDRTKHSIRLSTTETNDASGVAVRLPIEAEMTWTSPGRFMGSAQQCLHLLGNLYSLSFKTLSTKVPQLEVVNAVNHWNPSAIW